MRISDWSSDVCSSDLNRTLTLPRPEPFRDRALRRPPSQAPDLRRGSGLAPADIMLWEDCAPRGRRTRFTPPSARACSRCLRPEALRPNGKDPVPHVDDVAWQQLCVALAPVAHQLTIIPLARQRIKTLLGLFLIEHVHYSMEDHYR